MKIYSLITSLLLSVTAVVADDKSTEIFNGKDLFGWLVKYRDTEKIKAEGYWSVVDGAIQVETKGDTKHGTVWLCYDEELDDFELTLKTRSTRYTKGNSGIQIRSRYHSVNEGDKKKGGRLNGPQIDVHPLDPFRNGLIYDETEGVSRWIYPSKKSSKLSWTDADHQWLWRELSEEGEYLTKSNVKEELETQGLTKQEADEGFFTTNLQAFSQICVRWIPASRRDYAEHIKKH